MNSKSYLYPLVVLAVGATMGILIGLSTRHTSAQPAQAAEMMKEVEQSQPVIEPVAGKFTILSESKPGPGGIYTQVVSPVNGEYRQFTAISTQPREGVVELVALNYHHAVTHNYRKIYIIK